MTITPFGPLSRPIIKLWRLIVKNLLFQDHELKCGDTIRLEHALTKRNLHSEEIYQSMVTNGQEVSGYGFSGEGDDSNFYLILKMITGFCPVWTDRPGKTSMEEIPLSWFIKIPKKDSKCPDITNIHTWIGKTVHSKDSYKLVW